ncbi:MAG: hypothetical protein ABEH78_10725 [Haloferacaceae archaeon]
MIDRTSLPTLLLQGAVFALLVESARRRNVAATVNALGAFVLTLLPWLAEIWSRTALARAVTVGPELPLWLAVAGMLHSLGMLGLYESVWWWDHLTHTVSAALVAALVYAWGLVALQGATGGAPPSAPVLAVTMGSTFAVGVVWELIEQVARAVGERYDVEPVLVYYGWQDTAADLGFDVAGALLVLGLDLRTFVPLVEQLQYAM